MVLKSGSTDLQGSAHCQIHPLTLSWHISWKYFEYISNIFLTGVLNLPVWSGLLVLTVALMILSETGKVTCSIRAAASKDRLLEPVHRTLKQLHRCCTRSCSPVHSKFSEAPLRTQNHEVENQWLMLLSLASLLNIHSYWVSCESMSSVKPINVQYLKYVFSDIDIERETEICGIIRYIPPLLFRHMNNLKCNKNTTGLTFSSERGAKRFNMYVV